MLRWNRRLIAVAVAATLVIAVAPGVEERRYSCHTCRNLKYVTTRSFLFVRGTPIGREEEQFPISDGHAHDWWWYSTFKSQGIGGWLYNSVACRPSMYKDGVRSQEEVQQEHTR
jgi:hypothetical protein